MNTLLLLVTKDNGRKSSIALLFDLLCYWFSKVYIQSQTSWTAVHTHGLHHSMRIFNLFYVFVSTMFVQNNHFDSLKMPTFSSIARRENILMRLIFIVISSIFERHLKCFAWLDVRMSFGLTESITPKQVLKQKSQFGYYNDGRRMSKGGCESKGGC